MNQVVLVGRLTVDPELRYLPNTGIPIARFSVAVDRSYKKDNNPQAILVDDIELNARSFYKIGVKKWIK